ncbi:MAG TPA: DUF2076 family protein [Stellaceae bacterium]|nr:DUF2076 family protein [Stellaceae bacterium]
MTPQENTMLATLLGRLEREPQGAKDADAEAMIQRAAAARPDLAYLLAQTVLGQELVLQQARDRLAAATAAGVAGGALLLQGIQSMFGLAVTANLPQQPSLLEISQAQPAAERQEVDNAAEAGDPAFGDQELII